MKCFFFLWGISHLSIFFFQQKNLEVNKLFFHCIFRVYRIEVGCETLIAIKVVIVKMQQYLLKREYSKQVGNRQQGGYMSRTWKTSCPLFLCSAVDIKVMIILQLQFVERLVHDGTLTSP